MFVLDKDVKEQVLENGVVRKPTKEEKASHESYLQELVDAKR